MNHFSSLIFNVDYFIYLNLIEYQEIKQIFGSIIIQIESPTNTMTNRIKLSLFQTQKQHEINRLYIQQKQLRQFWESRTLIQMEQILTIKQQKLIQHMWQYFYYYLTNRKNASHKEAYYVCKNKSSPQFINNGFSNSHNQSVYGNANVNNSGEINHNIVDDTVIMYCYDCKIFKSPLFTRQDNQMLSCFLLRYKILSGLLLTDEGKPQEIYEFLNPNLYSDLKMIIKCKSSCLLKVYSLFKQLNMEPINGDVAILSEQYYYRFIYSWTHYSQSWEVQPMIRHLFRGFMILLQNQIALSFIGTLTEKQKEVRRYQKPVTVFIKPKLKETYTMVQQQLGDVQWNTLKVSAFKLKYRITEDETKYLCFRVKEEDSFDINMHLKLEELDMEDQKILMAFDKVRGNWQETEF